MRIIASLLGLVPVLAITISTPAPRVDLGGVNPDFAGTYSDCSIAALLPDVPPASIVIEQSFGGGVNDITVTPGAGSAIPEVTHTLIADGKVRNMVVQEFGVPLGVTRMVEYQTDTNFDTLYIEQTDDVFGTIVTREISIDLYPSGRLDYDVSFGPFIAYSVRCQAQGN